MRLAYRILSELFLLISPIIILYRIIKGKENIYRFPERYSINSEIMAVSNMLKSPICVLGIP